MYLTYELKRISKELDRHLDRILDDYDITAAQARVLRYLIEHQNETITQKDICGAWDLKHTTVIGLLRRLQDKGLVTTVTDSKNRRCNNVLLTEKGRQLSTVIKENLKFVDKKLTEDLTADELDQLLSIIEVLKKNVSKL